MSTFCFALSMT